MVSKANILVNNLKGWQLHPIILAPVAVVVSPWAVGIQRVYIGPNLQFLIFYEELRVTSYAYMQHRNGKIIQKMLNLIDLGMGSSTRRDRCIKQGITQTIDVTKPQRGTFIPTKV